MSDETTTEIKNSDEQKGKPTGKTLHTIQPTGKRTSAEREEYPKSVERPTEPAKKKKKFKKKKPTPVNTSSSSSSSSQLSSSFASSAPEPSNRYVGGCGNVADCQQQQYLAAS